MELKGIISSTHKEIVGSRTKNRLTIQISYAIQLIMELYTTDYLILMDYIEDVSVIENPDDPTSIHLYQIKTKSADQQYQLSTVISEEWYQKLYKNAQKYDGSLGGAAVVCNTDVVVSKKSIFPNAKTLLDEFESNKNIKKIKQAIAKDLGVAEEDVDLSKFYFIRSQLSVKGHKDEVEHEFEEFLLRLDDKLQVATVKSIYNLIYDTLDKKFNTEIDEDCTDLEEIFEQKGVLGRDVQDIVSCGLAIQIPTTDQLFADFEITSVKQRRSYSSTHSQIKMDMYSNAKGFIALKQKIFDTIERINQEYDDMPQLLNGVYLEISKSDEISIQYKDEYYLKMLIMILIYRYSNGG